MSEQGKWTKGPWRVVVNKNERILEIRDVKRKDGSSLNICEIFPITDRDDNAKLIAAAPEMYEALAAWEKWYGEDSTEFNRDVARDMGLKALHLARGEKL